MVSSSGYGHIPEHQSLWVRGTQSTPLVFTADARYTQEHLGRDVLTQSVWNADAMFAARINTDGSVVTACVDSEKAARAFLSAPIEKVATKKAKDE